MSKEKKPSIFKKLLNIFNKKEKEKAVLKTEVVEEKPIKKVVDKKEQKAQIKKQKDQIKLEKKFEKERIKNKKKQDKDLKKRNKTKPIKLETKPKAVVSTKPIPIKENKNNIVDNWIKETNKIKNDTVLSRWGMLTHDERYKDNTAKIIKFLEKEHNISNDQAYYFLYYMARNNIPYKKAKEDLLTNQEFEMYDVNKRKRGKI